MTADLDLARARHQGTGAIEKHDFEPLAAPETRGCRTASRLRHDAAKVHALLPGQIEGLSGRVAAQHGLMQGTLVEKRPMKFNLGSYEGHLSFLPADKKAEHVAATAARTLQHQG